MSKRNSYFAKFPLTEYDGNIAINLLKRVDINSNVRRFYTSFYPHTVNRGEKIDHISFNYYDDVDFDWIIYHANDIIDPYYDVNFNEDDFENYIERKYESKRNSLRKVIHYKNNWQGDDSILSKEGYNALLASQKKYWKPILNAFGVVGYDRSKEDYIASTNKIESIYFSVENSEQFTKGENIVRDDDSSSIAEITWSDTNSCVIQHIRGEFSGNTNYTVTGESSGVTATINAESHSVLLNVISPEEQVYFSPVYAYDYESDKNEENRNIYLVDAQYSTKLNAQLEKILR